MNVLSIGNSFSQDAHRYLSRIAKADGVCLNTFNLYIGGCSLSMHYRNMMDDNKAYTLEVNGESTGFKVSLKEALLNRNWDVVTLQQVSEKSVDYETYQPYMNKIAEYVRQLCPKAKIVIHQTWAYKPDSPRLTEELEYGTHNQMFADIKKSIHKAFEDINADYVIPSGEVINKLIDEGFENIHRDNFHASKGVGRYAVALMWYIMLTGNDIENNTFSDFDENITDEEIKAVKRIVRAVYNQQYKGW